MACVVVLKNDWECGRDPVPYHATDPEGCLDFNSSPAKPRSILHETGRTTMGDCAHGVIYDVVICEVGQ